MFRRAVARLRGRGRRLLGECAARVCRLYSHAATRHTHVAGECRVKKTFFVGVAMRQSTRDLREEMRRRRGTGASTLWGHFVGTLSERFRGTPRCVPRVDGGAGRDHGDSCTAATVATAQAGNAGAAISAVERIKVGREDEGGGGRSEKSESLRRRTRTGKDCADTTRTDSLERRHLLGEDTSDMDVTCAKTREIEQRQTHFLPAAALQPRRSNSCSSRCVCVCATARAQA